jgi:sec-independent protein translocase protein TatB
VFGVGFQEMLIVGLLLLVLFGPKRLPQMARDLGSFASKAQHVVDEFKAELASEVEDNRNPKHSPEPRKDRKLEKDRESTPDPNRAEGPSHFSRTSLRH